MTTAQLRARLHEIRCPECRVTWHGWIRRIVTGREQP